MYGFMIRPSQKPRAFLAKMHSALGTISCEYVFLFTLEMLHGLDQWSRQTNRELESIQAAEHEDMRIPGAKVFV